MIFFFTKKNEYNFKNEIKNVLVFSQRENFWLYRKSGIFWHHDLIKFRTTSSNLANGEVCYKFF